MADNPTDAQIQAAEAALARLDADEGTWPTGEQVEAIITAAQSNAGDRGAQTAAAEQALARLDADEGTWPTGEQVDAIIDAATQAR